MEFNLVLAIAFVCVVGVLGGSGGGANNKTMCIHNKHKADLGQDYETCHTRSGALPIPRIKQCAQEVMKKEGVVVQDQQGQMTVNREKFGEYGRPNNNNIRKAVKKCYDNTRSDDRMYQEAARAIQCIFDQVKQTC